MKQALKNLQDRGFIAQTSNLDLLDEERQITAYIGFDLTAPSLHVGSLIQLMVMRTLVAHGHRVIALMGGATTKVGDPSGKDKSRPMLTNGEIHRNFLGIEKVVKRIVPAAEIVSNEEWFNDDMSFMRFMQDYGPHFTINRMVGFDTVKRRLEEHNPMTFLEFTYMLLQAVDFLKLWEHENCTVQIGGSDQWGNMINGVELVRKVHNESVHCVTTHLLTDKNGKKMGKSEGGAVWLDRELTAPFDFFQFWRNVEDEKVEQFENFFTSGTPIGDVDINTRKERLAFEVTALVHGEDTAKDCLTKAHHVFKEGCAADEVRVEAGETVSQVIVKAGFAESRNKARQLIAGNAVSIAGEKIAEDIEATPGAVLRVGKKKSARMV